MEVDGRSNGNGKMLVMLCFLVCKSAAGSLSPMCTLRTRAVWRKHCHPKLYFNNYFLFSAQGHMAPLWLVPFCSYSRLFEYIISAYVTQGLFRLSQWLDDEKTNHWGRFYLTCCTTQQYIDPCVLGADGQLALYHYGWVNTLLVPHKQPTTVCYSSRTKSPDDCNDLSPHYTD